MKESSKIALRIWFCTSLILGIGFAIVSLYNNEFSLALYGFIVAIAAALFSLPALLLLFVLLPFLRKSKTGVSDKWWRLIFLLLLICVPYGIVAFLFEYFAISRFNINEALTTGAAATAILFWMHCNRSGHSSTPDITVV